MSSTTSTSSGRNVTVTLSSDALADAIVKREKREIHVPIDMCEWRDSGDPEKPNETTLRGHAAVFNSLSDDLGGFKELIAPGFFRAALRKQPDVRLLYNHDPNFVLARTASGTLELREDQRGLHVFARVDKSIGWVNDLRTTMQRGDVDQMSFAFTVAEGGDDWAVTEDDNVVRTLLPDGAAQIFDASVVTYPAYRATEVSMRSVLEDAIASGRLPETVGATPGIAAGIADTDPGVVVGVEDSPEIRALEYEKRADVDGLSSLLCCYWDVMWFLHTEYEDDDKPERDIAVNILKELEQLMEIEAAEPSQPVLMPGAPVERLMVSGALAVSAAFVAYNVTGNTPLTAGTPEIKPVTGLTLKPVGKPTAPNVIGRVPVAVMV